MMVFPPGPAAAAQQQAQRVVEERTGQEVTQQQILERLRASGLSREQVRQRLQQAGYDPSLAEPYFDRLEAGEGSAEPGEGGLPSPSSDFLSALQQIGIAVPGVSLSPEGRQQEPEQPEEEAPERATPAGVRGGAPPLFGASLFARSTSEFQPVTTGPVDPDYRLGPGDQIILVITGDVELAYTLDVSREGFIVIPDVGQLSVNGLTLGDLEDRLYDRIGDVYSGVSRGPDATTHFNVSIGRLRRNQVYLIGEVREPGAYQVSSVATAFNALYRAGGPAGRGTFRRIEVRRGGDVVQEIDIYDYLLEGDTRNDVRLYQGDIVFVPLAGPRVTVQGRVRRPGRFELTEGENLRDVIRFAGGLAPEAFIQRIQIDRILPPDERRPGRERVLLDVDLSRLEEGAEPVALRDGDRIQVFGISDERRNRVTLRGRVFRPGAYEYTPGMSVWDLIQRADGLLPEAFSPVAHVFRLNPEDRRVSLHRVSLRRDSAGSPVDDMRLRDLDEVVVYGRGDLLVPRQVQILGEVKNPGSYPLAEGMTVQDLVLAAGGYTKGVMPLEAEVIRLREGVARSDTLARSVRVALGTDVPTDIEVADGADEGEGSGSATRPRAAEFTLRDQDRVFIRRRPGYEAPRTVQVAGEVLYPGSYGLERRGERLSSVIERAGGLTSEAYPPGSRLIRDSVPIGADLEEALDEPGSADDVMLEAGDRLVIPDYDPTVLVTGAVAFESRILYRDGMGFEDFVKRAGGFRENADEGRASVRYPSGERDTPSKFLFWRSFPDVEPGSTIHVPVKPESDGGFDVDRFITRTLGLVSTTATVIIALDRL